MKIKLSKFFPKFLGFLGSIYMYRLLARGVMHTPAPPPRSSADSDWTSHTPHSTIRHIPRHIGTQSDFEGYLYSLTTLTVNVYRKIPHFCQQRSSRDQPSCKRCHFHSRHDESVEKYNTILGKQIHTNLAEQQTVLLSKNAKHAKSNILHDEILSPGVVPESETGWEWDQQYLRRW